MHPGATSKRAWPANDVLAKLRPGDGFKLQAVAAATADAAGSYTLRMSSTSLLSPMTDPSGIVNLEIDASSPDAGSAPFNFPRHVDAATGGLAALAGAAAAPLVPAAATSVEAEHADLRLGVGGIGVSSAPQHAGGSAAIAKLGCSNFVETNYGPQWATVGQSYSTTTSVLHQFTYSTGADSSLGVGFSTSGKYGSFSANGTVGVSSSGTQGFPVQGNGSLAHYETEFVLQLFNVICPKAMSYHEVRATSWAGGSRIAIPGLPPTASWCVPELGGPNSYVEKTTTTAIKWAVGFHVGSLIGIDLSAQTGYDVTAKVRFTFPAGDRHLCGTTDYPLGTPSQLVAHP